MQPTEFCKFILCIDDHIYILYLNVFYKKMHTSAHIDSVLMTTFSEVSTRKFMTMAKKVVFSAWYKTVVCKNSWYIIVLVYGM